MSPEMRSYWMPLPNCFPSKAGFSLLAWSTTTRVTRANAGCRKRKRAAREMMARLEALERRGDGTMRGVVKVPLCFLYKHTKPAMEKAIPVHQKTGDSEDCQRNAGQGP